jgi:cystathionine beta-lyase
VKWHRPGRELIPAWVADMDYPFALEIRAATEATIDRGDLGYPDWPAHPLAEPFSRRMQARYNWSPNPDHVRGVTDLIQALQIVISLATRPGDGVVAHVPNYPPFLATITNMSRTLISAPLQPDGPSSWSWDHEQLEADLTRANAKVLLLVNPHKPTGRVFTESELRDIADLAERHDLIVVSDEIHAELTHHPTSTPPSHRSARRPPPAPSPSPRRPRRSTSRACAPPSPTSARPNCSKCGTHSPPTCSAPRTSSASRRPSQHGYTATAGSPD